MNYRLTFEVSLAEKGTITDGVPISDQSFFNELRSRYPDRSINPKWFEITVSYEDAIEHGLFEKIEKQTAKKPIADSHFVNAHAKTHFAVNVERIPSEEELNQSRWLYLTVPELSMAKFKSVEPDDSYVISKVSSNHCSARAGSSKTRNGASR